ncbi:MAG: RpoL/Rpb11 RNA polymerase subunit family protein [Candidatus Heimdallarchaeaceae archaeon]
MKIKILKQDTGYIKFNVRDTNPHTIFNLLREELQNDPDVDFAGYWRNESFYESIIFQVRMKNDQNPIDAINKALERIKEKAREFIEVCNKIK